MAAAAPIPVGSLIRLQNTNIDIFDPLLTLSGEDISTVAVVRKRTLKSGKVRWQLDYRDRNGKRRHKQFIRKADADVHETKIRSEIAAGTHVAESDSIAVNEAGDLWLRRGEREGLEAGTLRQYRQHLKYHISPLLGITKLARLTTPAVERFRDELLQTRSRPMTRAVLTSLKGILKEAKRLGLIGHNPAAETAVSDARRHRVNVEIPEKDEIRAMLAKVAENWPLTRIETSRDGVRKVVAVCWRPFIVTAIFTGLRCSELRGLTWEHVDFQEGVVRVRQRADFQNDMGAPKSEAGKRDVPMAPMVSNTLKNWKLACPKTPLDLVFPTQNGSIHSNGNIHKQCWRPLQRAAGVTKVTGTDFEGAPIMKPKYKFHALRHAAASLFIEQGWSPKKIQTVMGHSSIQITFDTYGHLWKNTEDDLRAMAQIEARLLA